MNGNSLYEDPNRSSVDLTNALAVTTTTSLLPPSTTPGVQQPLHIPAKRLTPNSLPVSYVPSNECSSSSVDPSTAIRHNGQTWTSSTPAYSPENHSAFDAQVPQYNHGISPGYYYSERKTPSSSTPIKFWSNTYEVPNAGPSTTIPADACHQSFAPQTWCNYSPYPSRVHPSAVEPHVPQAVSYFPTEDRSRLCTSMDGVYTQSDTTTYSLRNFPAEVHCPSTYVQQATGE